MNKDIDCPHYLNKSECVFCSGKYPEQDKLDLRHCNHCGNGRWHYKNKCIVCGTENLFGLFP